MKRNSLLLLTSFIALAFSYSSCKKKDVGGSTPPPPPTDTTVVIKPAVDPPLANTIGFFLDDWQPRTFAAPSFIDTALPTSAASIITVNPGSIITKVPRSIFGNNANLWMTQMVTEPSLMTHITNIHPHIIRFPGGSISDVFFWNAPRNTPPSDAPLQFVKANGTKEASGFWYGKNTESWTFSVDNYYNMLQQTGNTGMITVNYGYARYGTGANPVAAAAHLAADWVRYDNGRTKYWEIGNENYGEWEAGFRIDPTLNKDNQPEIITGDIYGQHVKIFIDSMKKAAQEIGKTIHVGALMVESQPQSWNTNTIKTWNTGLMAKAGNTPDFFIIHNYFTPYQTNSNAGDILATGATETKKMMDFVSQALQTGNITTKPVALTEWNIFAEGSMQQVSHVNGMHGVLVLGESIKNKYGMTSRWDLANGWSNGNDHGMFSNGDEPGVPKWNPRPAFYHMYFFQKTMGDRLVASTVANNSDIQTYGSSFTSGEVGLTLVNKSSSVQSLQINVENFNIGKRVYWYALTGGTDNGEFSRKVFVNGNGPAFVSGGPADYATLKAYSANVKNGFKMNVPPRSVICMMIEKK